MRMFSEIWEITTRSSLSHLAVQKQEEALKRFLSQLCHSPAVTNDIQDITFFLSRHPMNETRSHFVIPFPGGHLLYVRHIARIRECKEREKILLICELFTD